MTGDATKDARELVLRAFAKARQSRKDDWQRMTVAVLKNRLLQLTDREFDVADYGATDFDQFLASCSGFLRVVANSTPRAVELTEASTETVPHEQPEPAKPSSGRLRQDLWNAVMDFSGPHVYIWDEAEGLAIRVPADHRDLRLKMPTLTPDEYADLRRAFLARHSPFLDKMEEARARNWHERALGTRDLPPRLQRDWNAELKTVAIDRLDVWFRAAQVTPPLDIIGAAPARVDTESLRAFIRRCVDAMSEGELAALPIPAGVAARVRR